MDPILVGAAIAAAAAATAAWYFFFGGKKKVKAVYDSEVVKLHGELSKIENKARAALPTAAAALVPESPPSGSFVPVPDAAAASSPVSSAGTPSTLPLSNADFEYLCGMAPLYRITLDRDIWTDLLAYPPSVIALIRNSVDVNAAVRAISAYVGPLRSIVENRLKSTPKGTA